MAKVMTTDEWTTHQLKGHTPQLNDVKIWMPTCLQKASEPELKDLGSVCKTISGEQMFDSSTSALLGVCQQCQSFFMHYENPDNALR